MTDEEKAELNFIEFDHNDLHFECIKGGMVVYKDGEKIGQFFDVFTKFIPPKEVIIKFWEILTNEFMSSSEKIRISEEVCLRKKRCITLRQTTTILLD